MVPIWAQKIKRVRSQIPRHKVSF